MSETGTNDSTGPDSEQPYISSLQQNKLLALWLEEARNCHQKTGNAFFCWQAFFSCLDQGSFDLPKWCTPYFRGLIKAIVQPVHSAAMAGQLDPGWSAQAMKRVLAALDLSSPGKNQLRNAASALRKLEVTKTYRIDRVHRGHTSNAAIDDVRPKVLSGRKRKHEFEPDLGADDRTVRAAVSEGMKLSGGMSGGRKARR